MWIGRLRPKAIKCGALQQNNAHRFKSECSSPYTPLMTLLVSSTWVIHDALANSTFHQGSKSPRTVIEQEASSTAFPSTALPAGNEGPNVLLWLAGRPRAKFTCATMQNKTFVKHFICPLNHKTPLLRVDFKTAFEFSLQTIVTKCQIE